MSAWKDLERRVCRALGAERAGPRGKHGADDDGKAPFSLECKRTTRYSLRRTWIEQARRQGKADGRPWLLVVAEHNDKRPLAVMDFWVLAELAQLAGLIGSVEVAPEPEPPRFPESVSTRSQLRLLKEHDDEAPIAPRGKDAIGS